MRAVTTSPDAEQALLKLDGDSAVDLLLADIALGPGMRGTELARRVQERDGRIKVLLMLGFAAEMLEPGEPLRWELLRKPCTRDELAQALARAPDDHQCAAAAAPLRWMKARSAPTSGISISRRHFLPKRMTLSRAIFDIARLTDSSVMPR